MTRVISYGGGVQSTALLVLAARGTIDFPVALFANTGDNSEHPETLAYVREVAIPYGERHGIEVIEVQKRNRKGELVTLYEKTMAEAKAPQIPLFNEDGTPLHRKCTMLFKVDVIGKWCKARGASEPTPATVAIGISVDEIERARGKSKQAPWQAPVYPLLELGLTRNECRRVIADAGLPVPPKSACYFCGFHRPQVWRERRRDEPELCAQAVHLEAKIRSSREEAGRTPLYLTKFGKPLEEAIVAAQDSLFDGPEGCSEEYCWT